MGAFIGVKVLPPAFTGVNPPVVGGCGRYGGGRGVACCGGNGG